MSSTPWGSREQRPRFRWSDSEPRIGHIRAYRLSSLSHEEQGLGYGVVWGPGAGDRQTSRRQGLPGLEMEPFATWQSCFSRGFASVSLKQLKIEGSKQNLRPLNCDLKLPEGKDNIYLPSRVLTNPRRLSGDITELLDGEWMDEWMDTWKNKWMDGRMSERMDRWMNVWMDGRWMNEQANTGSYNFSWVGQSIGFLKIQV